MRGWEVDDDIDGRGVGICPRETGFWLLEVGGIPSR